MINDIYRRIDNIKMFLKWFSNFYKLAFIEKSGNK